MISLRNKFYVPSWVTVYRHHIVTLHSTQVLPDEISDCLKIY